MMLKQLALASPLLLLATPGPLAVSPSLIPVPAITDNCPTGCLCAVTVGDPIFPETPPSCFGNGTMSFQTTSSSPGCCDVEGCFSRKCSWTGKLIMTTGGSSCVMIAGVNSQFEGRVNGKHLELNLDGWPSCEDHSVVTGTILDGNDYVTIYERHVECGGCED